MSGKLCLRVDKQMATPYSNCFQISKISLKWSPFSGTRPMTSPVQACLKNSNPMHLECKREVARKHPFASGLLFNPVDGLRNQVQFASRARANGHQRPGSALRHTSQHSAICNEGKSLVDSLKWDDKGLAVAIVQDVDTGTVLMQAFVNKEAVLKAISSRKATFFSRTRSCLWTKGETSKNFINICDIIINCDRDSIIYLGKPDGPTGHTRAETCYYTSVNDILNKPQVDESNLPLTTLYSLESTISKRKEELSESTNAKPSWTKRLLLDDKLLCSKIREEADELCRTLEDNEDQTKTASAMVDMLHPAMVLCAQRGVKIEEVLEILRMRFSQSGIEEKNSRKSQAN